jgi:hypothetical protein
MCSAVARQTPQSLVVIVVPGRLRIIDRGPSCSTNDFSQGALIVGVINAS